MDANLAAVIACRPRSFSVAVAAPSGRVLARQPDPAVPTFINGVTKYVATSTPLDRDWANATAVDGALIEFVRDLKQQTGGDVGVHASISVAQALLAPALSTNCGS